MRLQPGDICRLAGPLELHLPNETTRDFGSNHVRSLRLSLTDYGMTPASTVGDSVCISLFPSFCSTSPVAFSLLIIRNVLSKMGVVMVALQGGLRVNGIQTPFYSSDSELYHLSRHFATPILTLVPVIHRELDIQTRQQKMQLKWPCTKRRNNTYDENSRPESWCEMTR